MQDEIIDKEFEDLKNSKFKQQKLPSWRPVPTITSTTLTFLFFGIAFIIIGIVVITFSNKIVETSVPYDKACNNATDCSITFNLAENMTSTIMVYYQLNNFYQNHRRYVQSKSSNQLLGNYMSVSDLKTECDPIVTMADLGLSTSYDNIPIAPTEPANPCGLIAKSKFNDTFVLLDPNGVKVDINSTGIAWQADKDLKYKKPANSSLVQWTDVTDEHFMVWMRPAGLPNFRKLWGRIQTRNLTTGTYTLKINNIYPVYKFNGEKYFVLSTVNAFGGKNQFLGIAYIVVGVICILMAIAFFIGYKCHNKRKEN